MARNITMYHPLFVFESIKNTLKIGHWKISPFQALKYVNRSRKLSEIFDSSINFTLLLRQSSFLVFLDISINQCFIFWQIGIPLLHNIPLNIT